MTRFTLNDLSGNAFRILGLTATASQAQIDDAARKMRIWSDPSMIPASVNDAKWIGPIPRGRQDIENAVARLADPLSRLQERFWWFCLTPPALDAAPRSDPSAVPAYHDAALIYLYRALLSNASQENLTGWRQMVERFKILADSDDYLQWLFEIESNGDFEKRASLDEIAQAQQQLLPRLSTAVVGSVDRALANGDFGALAQAIEIVRVGDPQTGVDPAEALLDRLEDDLAGRCNEFVKKIDTAWETKLTSSLRPACNHVIARFGHVIQPLIDQIVSATQDVDRQNRDKMLGVSLLVHTSEAYKAFQDFLACQRTLRTALLLAANTPMEPSIEHMLAKISDAAQRQRAGASAGHRQQTPGKPQFKIKPGGKVRGEWFSAFPVRWLWWLIVLAMWLVRAGCSVTNTNTSTPPSNPVPQHHSYPDDPFKIAP